MDPRKPEAIRTLIETGYLETSQDIQTKEQVWKIKGATDETMDAPRFARYYSDQVTSFIKERQERTSPGQVAFYEQVGARLFRTYNGFSHPRTTQADEFGEIIEAQHVTHYRGKFSGQVSIANHYWLYISMTGELIHLASRALKRIPAPRQVIANMVRNGIRS